MKGQTNNFSMWTSAPHFIKGVGWKMAVALAALSCLASISLHAQIQTQIPTLQVCNLSTGGSAAIVQGREFFKISERADPSHHGVFGVSIDVQCDPLSGYPTGFLTIYKIDMTDSVVQGTIGSTTIDQVTIAGHDTPTAWLSGRCSVEPDPPSGPTPTGCRYWIMLVNNKNQNAGADSTPDIASFLVFDSTGSRIAYGTAPALSVGSPSLFISQGP